MLQQFRKTLQGALGKVIIGFIVVTLSVFGFGSLTWFATGDTAVAVVNGERIELAELRTQVAQERSTLARENEEDPEVLEALQGEAFVAGVLNRLIASRVLRQTARAGGWEVLDEAIDAEIRANPEFQINGQYDPELFLETLAASGFTALGYRNRLSNLLLLREFSVGISDTTFILSHELDHAVSVIGEMRDISWLVLPTALLEGSTSVSPEQIAERYELNQLDYLIPSQVVVEYVELNRDELARGIEVTEEALRAAYEAEKAEFEPEEQRRAAHILLEINEDRSQQQATAEALDILARARSGEDFGQLAKIYSEDSGSASMDGDLGMSGRGVFVPEFEEALWALSVDEISSPVRTQFGIHLIKLLETASSTFPEYEELKVRLRSDIAQDRAQIRFDEDVIRLSEVSFESGDLKVASEILGLPIIVSAPFSLAGDHYSDPTEGRTTYRSFRQAAFNEDVLEQGYNSPVLELDEGLAVVLRTIERIPEKQQTLEEVSSLIADELRNEEAVKRAGLRMNAAREELLAGKDKALLAEELGGLIWQEEIAVSRSSLEVPPILLQAAFEAPRPRQDKESIEIVSTSEGVALVVVSNARDGKDNPLIDDTFVARQSDTLKEILGRSGLGMLQSGLLAASDIDKTEAQIDSQ